MKKLILIFITFSLAAYCQIGPAAPTVTQMSGNSSLGGSYGHFEVTCVAAKGLADLQECAGRVGDNSPLLCHVMLYQQNKILLLNDAGTDWTGWYAPGANSSTENSACKILASSTSVTVLNGYGLVFKYDAIFKSTLNGVRNVGGFAADANWVSYSGWQPFGTFTVNAAPPALVMTSWTPTGGSSNTPTFTVTATDTAGYGDIQYIWAQLQNTAAGWPSTFSVLVYPNANFMYLLSDDASTWSPGCTIGSNTILSNSQGSLNCAQVSVAKAGNTAAFTYLPTLTNAFAGIKPMIAAVYNNAGAYNLVNFGNWTIPTTMQTTGSFGASRDERVISSSLTTIDTLNGQTVYVPTSDHPLTSISITGPAGDDPAVMKFHDMFTVVLRDAKPNSQVWARLISYYPDVHDPNGVTTVSYSPPNTQGNIICGTYVQDNQTPEYSGGWLVGTTDATGYFTMSAQVPALGGGQTVSLYVGADSGTVYANSDPPYTCPAYNSSGLIQNNYVASVSYWATDANNNPTPPVYQ